MMDVKKLANVTKLTRIRSCNDICTDILAYALNYDGDMDELSRVDLLLSRKAHLLMYNRYKTLLMRVHCFYSANYIGKGKFLNMVEALAFLVRSINRAEVIDDADSVKYITVEYQSPNLRRLIRIDRSYKKK